MTNAAGTPSSPAERVPLATCFALVVGAWIAHLVVRETFQPGHPLRLIVTVLLVAAVALLAWVHVRAIRSQDEFVRAVHATALAIAFPTSIVVALAIGLARDEGLLSRVDPHDLPVMMLAIWMASVAIARRRYR